MIDTSELDKESAKLEKESVAVAELFHKCVKERDHSAADVQASQQRYAVLLERYERAKEGLKKLSDKKLDFLAKRESIQGFIRELELGDTLVDEFDEGLWMATVDAVVVRSEHEVTFRLRHGLELDWEI